MENHSTFQEDRDNLLEKALSNLDQLNSNLNSLNRNLETINDIGSQFKAPAHLWSSFHKTIKASNDQKEPPTPSLDLNTPSSAPKPIMVELEDPSLGEEDRL